MATVRSRQKKVVQSPPLPGPNSIFMNLKGEKETVRWGGEEKLVYIEPIPVAQRHQKQHATHPVTGEKIYHDAPKGMMPKAAVQLVEILPLYVDEDHEDAVENIQTPGEFINRRAWREHIVDNSMGNGTCQHVYMFREDPERLARMQRAKERQARLDRLLDTLADADLDPDDLTAALDLATAKPATGSGTKAGAA